MFIGVDFLTAGFYLNMNEIKFINKNVNFIKKMIN